MMRLLRFVAELLVYSAISVMFWYAVGCGDPSLPFPPAYEAEPAGCSGQMVTVCDPECRAVCQPRLTPEIAEACTEACEGHPEPVDCAWECAREVE